MAAGFDKNAQYLTAFWIGFGFVEVEQSTPQPQPGNDLPRLFRFPSSMALVNRMGFNNRGTAVMIENLKRQTFKPVRSESTLEKNKVTELEKAVDDYVAGTHAMLPYADYLVVNLSSPNTPGLRSLQEPAVLKKLLVRFVLLRKMRRVF